MELAVCGEEKSAETHQGGSCSNSRYARFSGNTDKIQKSSKPRCVVCGLILLMPLAVWKYGAGDKTYSVA